MMKRIGNITIFMLVFFVGCLGGQSKKTTSPDCAAGQSFDSVSRSCQGAVVTNEPPVPSLSSFSIIEDSTNNIIELTYTDINQDLAYTCAVSGFSFPTLNAFSPACTCTGGVCSIDISPQADFNGNGDFFYTVTDDDGVSVSQYVAVTVASINDVPDVGTGTAAMTVDEDANLIGIDLTAVTATVTSAATFSDTHGVAANESNTPLEYEISTHASYGISSIDSSTGFLSYKPSENSELSSGDSIIVGVRDSIMKANGEAFIPVTVTITAGVLNADTPKATTVAYATDLTEDTAFTFNAANGQLGLTEYDSADFGGNTYDCTINPNTSDVFQTGACTCAVSAVTGLGLCDVAVLPKQNVEDGDNPIVEYIVTDVTGTDPSTSSSFTLDFIDVDDDPVAFATVDSLVGDVAFNELAGPAPPTTPETFTVDSAWDEAVGTVTYNVTTVVAAGTLSGCMSNDSDLSCNYTPTSGNLENGLGLAAASGIFGDLTLTSLVKGVIGNSIDVTFTAVPNIGIYPQVIVSSNNQDMTIYIDDDGVTTTSTHVANAIANHDIAKHIVTPAFGGAALGGGAITLAGGVDGYADSFTYEATDAAGNTNSNTINISITGTNDKPVMCNYSTYSDLNECGGLGCIGTSNPTDAGIVPSTHATKTVIFFNNSEGVCWKSNGATAGDWEIVVDAATGLDPSHIQDIIVNEGEGIIVIDNFGVDEGGQGNEDLDSLQITSIVSDNPVLVPSGNISFYFNNAVQVVNVPFGGATSEGLGDFKLNVVPQVGNTGTANITITLADTNATPATSSFTFAVTVQAYSAIHNGWKNITAVGPKFDKFDQLKDSNKNVCTYNVDKCDGGQECTQATLSQTSPIGTVAADEVNALYYNASADTCFIATTAGSTPAASVWESLETACAATPTNLNSNCTGASCIGSTAPAIDSINLNEYFYDNVGDVCYRSIATGAGTSKWEVYSASSEITIEWEDFDPVPASESITSYEVYRRLANEDFDYTQRLNRDVIDDSITTYADNAQNSFYPPVPGTVYYYEIRPVIQSVSTNTDEVFKTIRVTSPPDNMVFVHRWMVNKSMCELMHSTSIDPNNNYRCLYEGPGDSGGVPGTNFYDIGFDLLVDRFEAGCNYGGAPECIGTSDGACVGIDDPTTAAVSATSGSPGTIYYARSSGQCYVSTGVGATWAAIVGTDVIGDYVKSYLPPLVNISQSDANDFCSQSTVRANKILGIDRCNASVNGCTGSTQNCDDGTTGNLGTPDTAITGILNSVYEDAANNTCYINTDGATAWTLIKSSLAKGLPSRKIQMAYSLWDTENNTDSQITTVETGLSLNSSAKCNSSQANGLSSNYSDVNVPDSNTFYSLPGTDTSDIRSMVTGSEQTNTCNSRFGVQDHVGNVAEWTTERFNCLSICPYSRTACDTANSQCTGAGDPNGGFIIAAEGTYYLDGASCFINTDGSDTWLDTTLNVADKYGASFCTSLINGEGGALSNTTNDMRYGDGTDQWFGRYILDGAVGPCVDSNSDDACDGGIDSWALEDERNSAGRYSIPMGLPIVTDFNSNFPSSNLLDWLFEIGPTSGITSTQLRDDKVDFDTATIASELTGCGGMATGGSYLDGSGAGVYSLELLPCTDSARSHITVGDVTVAQVGTGVTPNLEFNNPGPPLNANEIISVNAVTGQIIVNLRHDGVSSITSTAETIVRAINADGVASTFAFAYVSGNAAEIQSASAQTNFTETNKSDAMVDVGFRCAAPIYGYEE